MLKHNTKFLLSILLITILIISFYTYFINNWRLIYDPQKYGSVGYKLFLLNLKKPNEYQLKKAISKRKLIVFINKETMSFIPYKQLIIKYLAAGPNDNINITDNGVFINNKYLTKVANINLVNKIKLHNKIEIPVLHPQKITLANNQYWLTSDQDMGIDSRYFGVVNSDNFIGFAYAIY